MREGEIAQITLPENNIICSNLRVLSLIPNQDVRDVTLVLRDMRLSQDDLSRLISRPGQVYIDSCEAAHNIEGKLRSAVFRLAVRKVILEVNRITPDSVLFFRQNEATKEWEVRDNLLLGEDDMNYFYFGFTKDLSLFSIVGTSPPLLCSICEAGEWGECRDGMQTRLGNVCNERTGYNCQPVVEERLCEIPAPAQVPALPLEIIAIPIIAIMLGALIIYTKRGEARPL